MNLELLEVSPTSTKSPVLEPDAHAVGTSTVTEIILLPAAIVATLLVPELYSTSNVTCCTKSAAVASN